MNPAMLGETYAVRAGRRQGFGVQLYRGEGLKSITWADKGGKKARVRCQS